MTAGEAPRQPAPSQLAVAKVQTPDGDRLALQLTMLLDAAQAKALAAQLEQQAASMSRTGLVTASTAVHALAQGT